MSGSLKKISFKTWKNMLFVLIGKYNIYAPFKNETGIDYQLITENNIPEIIYNTPIPVTPLKMFFLPVKENVGKEFDQMKKNIIIGVPSCDLAALDILDEIYLNEPFIDSYYKQRREDTILIGTDCFSVLNTCHCTSYGVTPFPSKNYDIRISVIEDQVFLSFKTQKGKDLLYPYKKHLNCTDLTSKDKELIQSFREKVEQELDNKNSELPGYHQTGELIKESDEEIWKKYSGSCVSCGACATICPTCTCFLLVDRPGFEKIRQLDACQYPGFAKTAAGEDQLGKKFVRFRNRYLCKYVWKPEKFNSIACTGCGRCIDTCIGNINKNELFIELKNGLNNL